MIEETSHGLQSGSFGGRNDGSLRATAVAIALALLAGAATLGASGCGGASEPLSPPDASVEASTLPPGDSSSGLEDASVDAFGALALDAAPDAAGCTRSFSASGGGGVAATLTIDPTTTVNSFVPQTVFGINSAYWLMPGDVVQTQPKVQAAGNYFIRYPGGSSSDDYHWNGTGTYDSNLHWVPSDSTYSPGFPGSETYRGTTSTSYGTPANVTDGNDATVWLSNADTDFPAAQWLYVDLGGAANVTSLEIVWGTPYASSFQVQAWDGAGTYPPPYQAVTTPGWQTVSGPAISGTGGTQTVSFGAVTAQFIRVFMTASSGGPAAPYSIAEIRAFDGATQLTTNAASTAQSPTTASSTDPASTALSQTNFDFESFMRYVQSFTPAATPVITVNVGTGSPAEAAAWVHYANGVRGYGIRYWQIGNEMEGDWETGGPLNAEDYVRRYANYYAAMKAADPAITILGPVSGGIGEPSNLGDGKTFIEDFIGLLDAEALDEDVDAIDFHWYPNFGTVPDAVALATTSQLGQFATTLQATLAATGVDPHLPVFMTEYNMALGSPNTPVSTDQLVNGLWTADTLGQFIQSFGGGGGGTNLWNTISAAPAAGTTDPTAGDLGYLQFDPNAYRFQEHADYWAMQMMATDWAIGGDSRAHSLVATHSSQPLLKAYADQRPDGALALVVINENPTTAYQASIEVSPAPGSVADVWTFDASHYAWQTTAVPYHADPDTAPTHDVYCGATASTPFTLGPYSITVIRFDGAGGAGSPGPAEDAGTSVLIDDMSDPNEAQIRLPPSRPGDVAGRWYTYIGGGAGVDDIGSIVPLASSELTDGAAAQFTYTAIGPGDASGIAGPADAGGVTHAACMYGATPAAQFAYAAEGFTFEYGPTDAGYGPQYVDISAYTGLEFWMYNGLSTLSTVRLQVPDKESDPNGGICGQALDASSLDPCYAPVYLDVAVPPGWTYERVPFFALAGNPYYGYPQPVGGDMTTATDVHFEVDQPNAPGPTGGGPVPFSFCVSDIAFYR